MSRPIKIVFVTMLVTASLTVTSQAQIAPPRIQTQDTDRLDNLQDQLINRLRATTIPQQDYIRRLVQLVRDGKLQERLVRAIERKSLGRRPAFPFPYFEQAIKYEATKRGVIVLTVREFELAQANAAR